jgi:autotransporter-associated beta strand protein
MKTIKLFLCLLTAMLVPSLSRAYIVGPYTPDANTLFLLHFDEPAGSSATTNVGLKGGNLITVTNTTTGNGLAAPPIVTTMLGQTAYTNAAAQIGFGSCVSATNAVNPTLYPTVNGIIGYDGNKDGAYEGDVQSSGTPSVDAIALTNLNIGVNGVTPFTIEALICPTTLGANQEIVCTDSYWANTTPSRGFQFKITNTGLLQFNIIPVSGGSQSATIPTGSLPQAFVPGTWYHVAVTYDGSFLKFYWTKLDPSNTVANLIGTFTIGAIYGNNTNVEPLVIGNENRGSSSEDFQGLIDEVRISNVARANNQMQFYSPLVTINPQPVSQNIDDNMPVTFTLGGSSLTTLGYQWRFNGTPIPGATAFATNTSSYSIASVNLTNAGNYDCVVTNISGNSQTSSPAILVVGAGNFLAHRFNFNTSYATNTVTNILAPDSIGTNGPGTLYGDAIVTNGSLVLDGTTYTFMQMPSGYLHHIQAAATFDFWITCNTLTGNNDRIFDFGNTNGTSLGNGAQPNNYLYFSPHSGTVNRVTATPGTSEFEQTASASAVLDGETVHVTCVLDPPDLTEAIYTNGVLEVVNMNYTVPFASLDDQWSYLGRSLFYELNGDAFFNGSINDFRIYNGALSPTSILQSDIQGPDIILNDGPVQITNQPASTTTAPGLTVTFSGLAVGHWPITYQWLENGGIISGATNASYSFVASFGQTGHAFQLVATNNILGTNYTAVSTNATLTVVNPPTLAWLGVNGSAWDTSTLNWTNASTASLVAFSPYASALFDDRGGSQPTVNLTRALNPLAVTVNSTATYTLDSSGNNGSLTGPGTLTKANTGTLIIDVTNNMTGSVMISGGTLQIGNNDTWGAIAGPVTNNASLMFDRSDSTVMPSPIYGTGTVTMNSGNVTASGASFYTGNTFINSGITMLGNAAGLGATNGSITVANNAELYITANVNVGLNPLIIGGSGVSSAGALRKGGAGTTTYNGPVTLTTDTTMAVDGGATLNLTNSAGVVAASIANLTLNGSGAGNITGPLSLVGGGITVNGGTWTVAPSNNFSGLTTLNGGALRITGAQSLGPVPASFNTSQVTLNRGTLEAATNITLNDGKIGIDVTDNSGITKDTNATLTVSNQISGPSYVNLTNTGPGTLILNGANPFSGTLYMDTGSQTANDGKVVIANPNAISSIPAFAGLPYIIFRNENSASSTLALDGTLGSITITPDISLSGRTTPSIENLAGNNTISGNFTLTPGGAYILQSDSGTLSFTQIWPYPQQPYVTSARSVTLTGSGIISMTAGIQDATFGSTNIPINVFKSGSGILTLPVANAYSGTTVVSNGVLLLNGIIGTNSVTVVGGLLVGNGNITGPVTVQAAGAIEAGATNTIGTLNFSSTLALSGNTIVKISKAPPGNDQFTGQTSVTYGGTLTVTNLAGILTTNDTFALFTPGASASNFATIAGSPGIGLKYTFTNGVLGVAVGSKPVPHITSVGISGTTLTISVTNGVPSGQFVLLGSTNVALALTNWTPLLTNYFDSSGSINLSTNIINLAWPRDFYLLSQ